MDLRTHSMRLFCFFLIHFSTTAVLIRCEKHPQLEASRRWGDVFPSSDPTSAGSPYSLPPFDYIMGPTSSPDENPPYCVYPPFTPIPPSTTLPTPAAPTELSPPVTTIPPVLTPSPPEYPTPPVSFPSPPAFVPGTPTFVPSPPEFVPSPPTVVPGPPEFVPSPPTFVPSPPEFVPSPPGFVPYPPPGFVPSPPEFVPGPPIFLPPVVFPPPIGPPPPPGGPTRGLWCVAKPTVPDPIIQEAMNYACGSGADCDSIQPSGSCYQPDTLIAHASFAFNSYWQRTKVAGGTCDFGGTAMLVTKDPSYDGCRFTIY